ncbi:hypothetical protein LNP17_13770 [Klebsiella variicola subsp. variicola]|nr:hypothetical protein [Klebsiella variicola subsp. variicola]
MTLTATLTPVDSTDAVQWTSSGSDYRQRGFYRAKTAKVTRNAAGTATITGKARTFTATSEIHRYRALIYLTRSAEHRGSGFWESLC